jgi:hypothetical protein
MVAITRAAMVAATKAATGATAAMAVATAAMVGSKAVAFHTPART